MIALSALIPAAGQGERLGLGPKGLLTLSGRPLVAWVVEKAARVACEVVVAAPPGQTALVQSFCPQARVIEGAATRQGTVERLLYAARGEWLLIQDAARPFCSQSLLRTVAEAARETGVAGAFLRPDVPVAVIGEGYVKQHFRSGQVGIFQAPQAYSRDVLERVYAAARQQQWEEQSTLQLALRLGLRVRAVTGEKTNIKLTTPEDWALAQGLAGYLL